MTRSVPQKGKKKQEKPRKRAIVSVDDLSKPDPELLLAWYDQHARILPWRTVKIGKNPLKPNPYHVWLSEIMLQQTTVAAVQPYYLKFLKKWPTVHDLAAAELDDVMRMWAGLGYYRRARFLHACAKQVVAKYGGMFPDTEEELSRLDGIGPYTAAAVAAIAFDRAANVVDGNVERVVARIYALETLWPVVKKEIKLLAASLLPSERHGDYAQALMDLGATVCTPRSPSCGICPWQESCAARRGGDPETYPRRQRPRSKPVRRAVAFVLWDPEAQTVFLRKRPDQGLLAGMIEVPSSPWIEDSMPDLKSVMAYAPCAKSKWTVLSGLVLHSFTHFDLELCVCLAANCAPVKRLAKKQNQDSARWVALRDVDDEALPSVMRKILRFAFDKKDKVS